MDPDPFPINNLARIHIELCLLSQCPVAVSSIPRRNCLIRIHTKFKLDPDTLWQISLYSLYTVTYYIKWNIFLDIQYLNNEDDDCSELQKVLYVQHCLHGEVSDVQLVGFS